MGNKGYGVVVNHSMLPIEYLVYGAHQQILVNKTEINAAPSLEASAAGVKFSGFKVKKNIKVAHVYKQSFIRVGPNSKSNAGLSKLQFDEHRLSIRVTLQDYVKYFYTDLVIRSNDDICILVTDNLEARNMTRKEIDQVIKQNPDYAPAQKKEIRRVTGSGGGDDDESEEEQIISYKEKKEQSLGSKSKERAQIGSGEEQQNDDDDDEDEDKKKPKNYKSAMKSKARGQTGNGGGQEDDDEDEDDYKKKPKKHASPMKSKARGLTGNGGQDEQEEEKSQDDVDHQQEQQTAKTLRSQFANPQQLYHQLEKSLKQAEMWSLKEKKEKSKAQKIGTQLNNLTLNDDPKKKKKEP